MKTAVYCGTKNLYKNMLIAAKSLLMHSDVEKIYFLIEDDTFPYNLPKEIEIINISNQTYFIKNGPNYNSHWTYMVLIRAALSKIFPELDTVLSLDVDTIVNENISDIWDIDLTNYYLAAGKENCKSNDNFISINMGVVLFNLKKLREDHKDDEIINALNTKFYEYNEQDCISELCQNYIFELSPDYNVHNWADLEKVKHKKIIHFAAVKNWENLPLIHYYDKITNIKRNQQPEYKLDIIIPSYNNVRGLEQTLRSVYYKEHENWINITVINDNSVEDYTNIKKIYKNITFIDLNENHGPGYARNIGIKQTKNPYIMFIDAGDIIFSKFSFYEIKDIIQQDSVPDIYQWPWINGEWNTISGKNSTCTPGLIYKREFINLYNIQFSIDKIGSYSNEDIGFNHTCKAILRNIQKYDKIEHLKFYQTPIYKMIYDKDSLTHKNNNEFTYTKQIPGLAINAIHCIKLCEENQLDVDVIVDQLNVFMVELYRDYLYCNKKYPDLAKQHLIYIKQFYNNVYKKYEHLEINSEYLSIILGFKIKELRKITTHINIRRFITQQLND